MISFVYFDIGGVAVQDFSGNNSWQEFEKEIGVAPSDSQAFVEYWDSREDEMCKGLDAEIVFLEAAQKFNLKASKEFSVIEAFAKRFKRNEKIWPVISVARKKFNIGLLTNMYPNMLDLIFEKKLMPKVDWDQVIDSSVVRAAKPDTEIFEIAEEKCGAPHKEILFIDNGKRHVEAAKGFGWQTFWYDSSNLEKSSLELEKILNE